jgi:hypothetical protein
MSTPITWHNIAAPNFRDSILANQAAGENFNAAGANLQRILAEQAKVNNANFDNQTRIGTEEEIAAMQQAKDLGTLRGQEANFDIGPVRERQGVNADFDKITAVRNALDAKYLEQSVDDFLAKNPPAMGSDNSELTKSFMQQYPNVPLDTLHKGINSRIGDQVTAQTQTQVTKGISDKKDANSILANTGQIMATTGDVKLAHNAIDAANISDEARLAARQGVQEQHAKASNFTPQEQNTINDISNYRNEAINTALAPAANVLKTRRDEQKLYEIVPQEIYNKTVASAGIDGPLTTNVLKKVGTDGFWGLKTLFSAIANDEEFTTITRDMNTSLEKAGFNQEERNKIILGSVGDLLTTTETWNGLTEGYLKTDLLPAFAKNTQKMANWKSMEIDNTKLETLVNTTALGLKTRASTAKDEDGDLLVKSKLTGGKVPFNPTELRKNASKFAPSVPTEAFDFKTKADPKINFGPIDKFVADESKPKPTTTKEKAKDMVIQVSPLGRIYSAWKGAKTTAESAYELFQKLDK